MLRRGSLESDSHSFTSRLTAVLFNVREAGLEPARPKTQVPKTCVSANSTTPARVPAESRCNPGAVVLGGSTSR